ncbi:putative selenate ABC transporter substrate-binding protein [Synechococcus sp. BSF8S]|uniref:putative selenate ABC transporter substrate-binding protein n=1 Tax=Synechococcales TaxID=1890424 RepID=UPI0016231F0D|nr:MULTISPECIES: putative selenate ABC transporter substrate-binding protein [unclassified Synechococcus]MBC1262068.1 putative selenate ABC transporter substrate-binding protein [Synechococcus sp. BSF8S]MBC1264995.1 putative selenate ABC transporter substrate-binding protein [Synechococcus sp. BSA11S]
MTPLNFRRRPRAGFRLALLAGLALALAPAALPPQLQRAAPLLAGAQARQKQLRISAIPDQNPEKLNRLYGLVASELSRQLKVPVKYVPVTNYTAAVSAFRTGDLDLVWFGGLTGVQARLQKPGARVIAQRDIDASFHSVFIANTSARLKPLRNVKGLAELKGKRFTFGSESSTSGRLMPQHYLNQAGVKLRDFAGGAPGFSGSHDATIALVQSGAYQAGAVNEQVWKSNLRSGKADRRRVAVIWRTPGYPDYHWIAQPNLDQRFGKGFTSKLQKAFVGLRRSNPQQARILELFGAQKFIPAPVSQYAAIEKVGRQIGKIR